MREYKKHNPICSKFPHMLHGGDYNPDQWAELPEIINEDMRLIPLANCNAMSINIFSWQTIEPREGEYDFSFLDSIMDRLHQIGAKAILATPSGAKPAWMSQAHPEILRVSPDRHRELHGRRHNHCYTSPYYRKKVHEMNTLLAERYKDHPALILCIYPMNTAVSVIVSCVRRRSENGLRENITMTLMNLTELIGRDSGVIHIQTGRR